MKVILFNTVIFAFITFTAYSNGLKMYSNDSTSSTKDFKVLLNNKELKLYTAPTRYGNHASFGYFDFKDSVNVKVSTLHPAPHSTSWQILPLRDSIEFSNIKNGVISFTLYKPTNLTFIVNGDYTGRVLHLFADSFLNNIPKKDAPGIIYFEPGYHEIDPENNHILNIESNQSVYIAGGALVKGCIHASNAENIKIFGRGILMQDSTMTRARGIDIESCYNVKIEGIIINRNRDNWSGFIYKSDKIEVNGIKVISPAIWSTDGMNLANCKDASISNSFFRAGDDNIAIKGLGNHRNHSTKKINPNDALPNENILISNCTFWSDNNNAVVLGQETLSDYYRNISIKDCEVLFVRDEEPIKAALAVICLHSTDMNNILFENITVGPSGQLISVFNTEEIFRIRGSQSWDGSLENITFNNISAYGTGNKRVRVNGWSADKAINNVYLNNIVVHGDTIKTGSHYLDINHFTKNIIINGDTIKKPAM